MFRFTIRDVLWLTVVAAVLIAWLMDRTPMVSELTIRRGADKAFDDHQAAIKAQWQAMKDRKPFDPPSGGMFGRDPAALNDP